MFRITFLGREGMILDVKVYHVDKKEGMILWVELYNE
jgi:hypothetical protein